MSGPVFFVLGATHRQAPIEMRERLALTSATEATLHAELAAMPHLRELTLLCTCNRVEFYGVGADATAAAHVEAAFCAHQQVPLGDFARVRFGLEGETALQHLLEVAAGLDSQLIGETEIFGQVKAAYAAAQVRGSAGPVLNRVFQKCFQAAKHVRTHTAVGVGQVSVANVAVDLALSIFGSLASARVLLLGAGEIGEKTAKAFQSRGVAALTVASRSPERAMLLATTYGASALPFEQRDARLGEFDIVVCATAAAVPIVPAAVVEAAMKKRPARPLLLIDLALPRDIAPEAGQQQNVFLYNLDDLAKIADDNRRVREAEVAKGRALLRERASALWRQIEPQLRRENVAGETSAGPAPIRSLPST